MEKKRIGGEVVSEVDTYIAPDNAWRDGRPVEAPVLAWGSELLDVSDHLSGQPPTENLVVGIGR